MTTFGFGVAHASSTPNLSNRVQGYADEFQSATRIFAGISVGDRIHVMLNIFESAEALLLDRGWRLCPGPIERSEGSPMGYRFLSKERLCFFSAVQNAGAWMTAFIQAPLDQQAYLFMTVERMRDALSKSKPLSATPDLEFSQKSSRDSGSRPDQTDL